MLAPAWSLLKEQATALGNVGLAGLLDEPGRFDRFSISADGLVCDFSRCLATEAVLSNLADLALQCEVPARIKNLIGGAMVNGTEHRAALHSSLRGTGPVRVSSLTGGRSVLDDVATQRDAFLAFADAVRDGSRTGSGGQRFRHVINIGIGGSDLGPRLVADALVSAHEPLEVRFVAGIDGIELARALRGAEPATTLFVICSKTFTTLETRINAEAAKAWLLKSLSLADAAAHFAAVSVNDPAMDSFGVATDARFRIWDWVGGRYSLWSAIGLSAAIAIGSQSFVELLAGAAAMDRHFQNAPPRDNLPIMLGLLSVWHQNFCGITNHIVLPYDQRLALLPAYLQQLFMESLGKSVRVDGSHVDYSTGCPVWGSVGSHSQHSFAQLLHQGNARFQVDYIAAVNAESHDTDQGHQAGLANLLAQAESLARGARKADVEAALRAAGMGDADVQALLPHKLHPGGRPSNIILMRSLSARNLGTMLALYEHQVFVQAVIWGINPFDQWGVELGKIRAGDYSASLAASDFSKLPPVGKYISRWFE